MEQALIEALHPDRSEAAQLVYLDWLESHAPQRARVFRLDRELAASIPHPSRFGAWRSLAQVLERSAWTRRALQHYDVQLLDAGDRKISCIKEIRLCTGLGLREAKDIVDHTLPVLEGIDGVLAVAVAERIGRLGSGRVRIVRARATARPEDRRRAQIRLGSALGPVHADHLPVHQALVQWLRLELDGQTAIIATR